MSFCFKSVSDYKFVAYVVALFLQCGVLGHRRVVLIYSYYILILYSCVDSITREVYLP